MNRCILLLGCVLFSVGMLCGEPVYGQSVSRDSAGPRFIWASGELLLAGVAPFLFDRYVTRQDYAMISWQTVGHNLNPGSWEWDYDGFQTNQIGHPFHGSIFFNSFRSNGYGFGASVGATFAGSYLWETFAENQAPAPNDLINTGFGGAILGETTHRLAGKLVNNNSRGLKRQVAEVLAFLINPMNGFNRIVSGQWGKPVMCDPTVAGLGGIGGACPFDTSPLRVELDVGVRKYGADGAKVFREGRYGLYGRVRMNYGDPTRDIRTPFSNISIVAEAGQDDSAAINVVTVYGSLGGWVTRIGRGRQVLVLSANYDYFHNAAFLYSGQSIRANLFSHYAVGGKTGIDVSLGAGPVVLAAVPNSYLFHTRDYDYGPGLAYNAGGRLDLAGRLSYGVHYRGGWMKTINGNASHYFLHAVTNEVSVRVLPECSVSAELGYFTLRGDYAHFAAVNRTYPYLRL